jgi:hypothetical protein
LQWQPSLETSKAIEQVLACLAKRIAAGRIQPRRELTGRHVDQLLLTAGDSIALKMGTPSTALARSSGVYGVAAA